MSGEKISVIIPCYNVKDMVSECLDSIVAQTIGLEHLEIILIDDASADETVSVLKNMKKNIRTILCLFYVKRMAGREQQEILAYHMQQEIL